MFEDYSDGADDLIDVVASDDVWEVAGGTTTASYENNGALWQSIGVLITSSGTIDVSADVILSEGNTNGSGYTTGVFQYSIDNGSTWTTMASFPDGNASYIGSGGSGIAVSPGTLKLRFDFPQLKKWNATLDNILVVYTCPDADGDGVCDGDEIIGCTDPAACNYDVTPTTDTDNSLCTYVDGICETCEGGLIVDNDQDDDGVCDAVDSCSNTEACNYDASQYANEDCLIPSNCESCSGGVVVSGSGATFTLDITSDNYASETSWQVVDDDGGESTWSTSLTAEGQGNASTGSYTQCFPATGSYTFTIFDSANDGICCAYGSGSYTFTVDGTQLGTGGEFTTSESISIDFGCTDSGASNYDSNANVDNGTCAYAGCTEASACNYDAAATSDDGSCVSPHPIFGCDCSLSGSLQDTLAGPNVPGASYSSFGDPLTLNADGTPTSIEVTLDFTNLNGDASEPRDLVLGISDPVGGCVAIGGFNFTIAGCTDPAPSSNIWGTSWEMTDSGTYTATIDISVLGLTGAGEWSFILMNGWGYQAGETSGSSGVIYDLSFTLNGLCDLSSVPVGCTDPEACNYDESALQDDGNCIQTLTGDCACSSGSILINESLGGGVASSPVSFVASGNLGYVEVELDFVGAGSSWPADLLLVLTSPSGDCVQWGGYDLELGADCQDIGGFEIWPANWASATSGSYSAVLDLSAYELNSGSGTWSLEAYNGFATASAASYALSVQFQDLCDGGEVLGCMDSTSCNFNPDATIGDPGECLWLDGCGVCGGSNGDCSGCTNPLSCNYNPLALVDDGSCEAVDDPIVGCCSYTETLSEKLSGQQSFVWDFLAASESGLGTFDVQVQFAATGNFSNLVSDLVMIFVPPDNGDCFYFGEDPNTSLPFNLECTQIAGGWPDSWDTNQSGTYTASIDLSGLGLTGSGNWQVIVQNGDLQTPPAEYTLMEWTVEGLCYVEGCMEPTACNYTPLATVQVSPDNCVYADGACETCNENGTVASNDADGDGICDADEVPGCTDSVACNYDAAATDDDGSCDFCSCLGFDVTSDNPDYSLEVEVVNSDVGIISDGLGTYDLTGYSTYRLYVTVPNSTDFVSAISGDATNPLNVSTSTFFFQHPYTTVPHPNLYSDFLYSTYPTLLSDSWVSIGLEGAPVAGEGQVGIVQSPGQPWTTTFDPGAGNAGGNIVMNDAVGGSWYIVNGNTNGVAGADLKVLVGQFTTDGDFSGQLYCQVFPGGDGSSSETFTLSYAPQSGLAAGYTCGCTDSEADNFDSGAEYDDGACVYSGCTDPAAANYDVQANVDDGTCLYGGCTNACAPNYDPLATLDDGSCESVDGCMEETACNYDPCADVTTLAECEFPLDETGLANALATLPATLPANSNGLLALSSLDEVLGLQGACPLEFQFEVDDCGIQEATAILEEGEYNLTVTLSNGNASVSNAQALQVLPYSTAVEGACDDPAACNFSEVGDCYFPGQPCPASESVGGVLEVAVALADGSGCTCEARSGVQIWYESFDADGAQALSNSGFEPAVDEGYDFSDGLDTSPAPNENDQWAIDVDPSLDSGGTGTAGSWSVQGIGEDLYFEGFQLQDYEMGWRTFGILTTGYGFVRAEGDLGEVGAGSGDYVRVSLEEEATGDSLSGWSLEGGLDAEALWEAGVSPVAPAPDQVRINVKASCGTEGESVRFDDIALYGWTGGCTDSDASNYNADAQLDDGSCIYGWTTVYAGRSGSHTDRLWFDQSETPELNEFRQAAKVEWDATTTISIGSDVALRIDAADALAAGGTLTIGGLEVAEGGALFIPEGVTLDIAGTFDVTLADAIEGPGRLCPSGGWDWSAVQTNDTVRLPSLALVSGSDLTVPEGNALEIAGDLDFPADQSLTIGGLVRMSGEAEQQITGQAPVFDELVVDPCEGSDGYVNVLADSLSISGRLTIEGGSVYMNSNRLAFTSDAGGTGVLDMIPAGSELTNTSDVPEAVTSDIERFIAPDVDGTTVGGYTMYSSSLQGLTVADLDDIPGFMLTGFEGTDWPNNISSILFWNETSSSFVIPTGMQTPLDTLGGVWIAVSGSQNPTMSSTGALRGHGASDEVLVLLTRSASAEGVYRGWEAVQNPYQGRLDWEAIQAANPGVEDQYAIWDSQFRQFQRYGTQALAPEQLTGSRYIEPGNSFWVRVHADSSVVNFTLSPQMLDNDAAGDGFVRSSSEDVSEVVIVVENSFGAGHLFLRLSENGSFEYVHGQDASYLHSSSVRKGQLAIQSNGQEYISKSLPRELTLPLRLRSRANFATTIRVVAAPEGFCGRILDQETGAVLELIEGEEMGFTLPSHEADSGRFVLTVHDWARTEGLMPSCPEAVDGRVRVAVGEMLTANVSLMTPSGQVLDQALGVQGVEEFIVPPGDYGVIVTSMEGTCPKVQREVTVPLGEEPELLGVDWSLPECNQGEVDLEFELYGGGVFGWSLLDEEGSVVRQGADAGEVEETGLAPGNYTLEVDHACLYETHAIPAFDPDAPMAEAEWDPVVVLGEDGQALLQATCTTPDIESCRWRLPDGSWVESPQFAWTVQETGDHEILLEVEANGCTAVQPITFAVVSSLRMPVSGEWEVRTEHQHWTFINAAHEGPVDWVLLDVAGRLLSQGYVLCPGFTRVDFPPVQGVYWVVMNTPETTTPLRVFRP